MEIRVPQLAEGVESGTVVSVLVKEGDTVQKDQTVVELETQKAVATIPATAAGKVSKLHVKEGDSVPVGGLLVSLEGSEGGASAPAEEPKAKTDAPAQQAPAQPAAAPAAQAPAPQAASGAYQYQSAAGFPPPASPSVRKMARELGIDLSRVRGTEAGGRITMGDLRNYVAYLQQAVLSLSGAPAAVVQPAAQAAGRGPAPVQIDFSKWGPVEVKPMSQLRKTIAQAMVDSWTAIPHVTQFDDIEITHLFALRKKYVADYEKAGASLTLTSFIIPAVVQTLKKNAIFNTSLNEGSQELVFKQYYHIGIAVDTDHGLMVPVIRDADKKDMKALSVELVELAEKTRNRKISVDEMKGGTFTISNQGGIGGKHFTPIVNRPEAAILGLGRAYKAPVFKNGKVTEGIIMPVTLSYDHRLIDGGKAARFMVDLAEAIRGISEDAVRLKSGAAKKEKPAAKPKAAQKTRGREKAGKVRS